MLVQRWLAPQLPTLNQILDLFTAEGLSPVEETHEPKSEVGFHRHPFDEVRNVVQGEVLFDIAGNKLLLRAGDRIIIPSNTKHAFTAQGTEPLVCVYAQKSS